MNIGFPEKTDSFLSGQDILYQQFNDIDFYVEDENQENFYYTALKKVLPNIRIEKIFPLNGKTNVATQSALTLGDKRKVYIVDKDFDDILGIKITRANLFYLERYSIENYALEQNAIAEFIIEEKPRLNKPQINLQFNLDNVLQDAYNLFKELICVYLTIQKHYLGIENVNHGPERFCNFSPTGSYRNPDYNNYKSSVENALKLKDRRLSLNRQIKLLGIHFKKSITSINNIIHIPGKYILKFIKSRIERHFRLPSINMESFTFRLIKNCELSSLLYI